MLTDISIMIWKEWKEFLKFQSGKRSGLVGLLTMVTIFGVFMPIQWGDLWTDTAAPLGLWVVIPLILIGTLVADSIAGERERHTLETLLASRLSDRAILLGKIGASVSYVWIVTQLVFIVALIPVNVMHGKGSFLYYEPQIFLSGMLLSFLLACLMSNIGVLVSLRAGTVKQAQQTLSLSVFILAYMVPMAGLYLLKFVPEETRNRLLEPVLTGDITLIVGPASIVLTIIIFGLYAAAKARFQRSNLIFEG